MTARPVAQSLFPELRPEKPVGPLPLSVVTGTNADLMWSIRDLYLTGTVLDVTYGEGKWWERYRPKHLTAHDLHKLDGIDFRHLPEPDSSVDTVCYDPPYVPAGGAPTRTDAGRFRDAFGLQTGRTAADLKELCRDGLREVARVARLWALVKCSDFVDSGTFRLGHLWMIHWAEEHGLGEPHDLIVLHSGTGPGGQNIFEPVRCRRAHSYLLVFKVPA
jgi:hypothetical protein